MKPEFENTIRHVSGPGLTEAERIVNCLIAHATLHSSHEGELNGISFSVSDISNATGASRVHVGQILRQYSYLFSWGGRKDGWGIHVDSVGDLLKGIMTPPKPSYSRQNGSQEGVLHQIHFSSNVNPRGRGPDRSE